MLWPDGDIQPVHGAEEVPLGVGTPEHSSGMQRLFLREGFLVKEKNVLCLPSLPPLLLQHTEPPEAEPNKVVQSQAPFISSTVCPILLSWTPAVIYTGLADEAISKPLLHIAVFLVPSASPAQDSFL